MDIKAKYLEYRKDHAPLKANTHHEYERMLTLMYEELGEHPLIPIRTQSEYEYAIKSLAARFRWSASSRYRCSIIFEGFGEYAYRERVIDRKPYYNTFKKGNGKRVEFFTEAEFYQVGFNPFHSITDFAMTVLFWDCGMRRQELINLNVEDVNIQEGIVRVVNIKTGKIRFNPISPFTRGLMALYMSMLGFQGKLMKGNPLFYSSTWNRINKSTLAKHLNDFEEVDKPIKVFAHKFRHSLGGRIVANGGDISMVKEILGHENLNTTMIYTHFAKDKLKLMHEQHAKSFS